jgi:hypothetical protein
MPIHVQLKMYKDGRPNPSKMTNFLCLNRIGGEVRVRIMGRELDSGPNHLKLSSMT